jgi:hypothetical protein
METDMQLDTSSLAAYGLIAAALAVTVGCHSDNSRVQPRRAPMLMSAAPASHAPMLLMVPTPQAEPAKPYDETPITPMETVGAKD